MNKYFALEIGTARVCSNTDQPVIDAYDCIVYEGDDIEIIKTLIEQLDIEGIASTPQFSISYNPDHASLDQYKSAAAYYVNTHDYNNKPELIEQINEAESMAAIDELLGLNTEE